MTKLLRHVCEQIAHKKRTGMREAFTRNFKTLKNFLRTENDVRERFAKLPNLRARFANICRIKCDCWTLPFFDIRVLRKTFASPAKTPLYVHIHPKISTFSPENAPQSDTAVSHQFVRVRVSDARGAGVWWLPRTNISD